MSDLYQYKVTYNLFEFETLGYLPNAWVAKSNDAGAVSYADRKVYAHTLEDYGITNTPERQKLFDIIDDLQLDNITKKFNGKQKRPKPLAKLLLDKDIKKMIVKYIHDKLDIFLSSIVKNDFLLCIGFDRKDYIPAKIVSFPKEVPSPELFFKKTDNGIAYRLSFVGKDGPWKISSKEITVITNKPGWLIIDRELIRIPDINGNMVKPFFTKEELAIPRSYVKEYFRKFILRVVAKATISAEGFKVINPDAKPMCELLVQEDFMHSKYGISVMFRYSNNRFRYGSGVKQKTELQFNSEDDIVVYQHVRNEELEQQFIDKLAKMDIRYDYGNFFVPKEIEEAEDKGNAYSVHEWMVENRTKLREAGFTLKTPQIGNRSINLSQPLIQINLNQVSDWFDIFGDFHVGEFSFPFSVLSEYIVNGNRFFPLPDGSSFIIPFEWMTKYENVFQMGSVHDGSVRLTKSQYTVLDDFGKDSSLSLAEDNLKRDFTKINYMQPQSLKAELRPYQLEGIKWLIHLYHNNLGGCLADDMGLGKTLQAIAVLLYAKTQKASKSMLSMVGEEGGNFSFTALDDKEEEPLQALIIMPASLTFNWESEINKFAPELSVYKHIGNRRFRSRAKVANFDVILTSYHTALKDMKLLTQLDLEYLILDESQQIKNKNTKIFEAVNSLESQHKISLSGTPIENSLSDLWSQMQFINPELLGDFPFFRKNFMLPIEKSQNEEKKEQLKKLVAPYLLRRTKEEVAKDLPELTYKVLYTEMSDPQRKLYEKEKSAARNAILEGFEGTTSERNVMVLTTLLKLRQIANHPKLANEKYNKASGKFDEITASMEMIRKGKHKVLIFSQFVTHLELFKDWLVAEGHPYAMLTGATPLDKRDKEVKRFETDDSVQFFLISLKAGGTGLNLTAADYVFLADPWWNPSVEQQAIARAHRIGQDKNVIAIKFLAKGTIEEKILKLQEKKLQLADDIINNNEGISFKKEDLEYLLE